jgi:hypothetical protein
MNEIEVVLAIFVVCIVAMVAWSYWPRSWSWKGRRRGPSRSPLPPDWRGGSALDDQIRKERAQRTERG